MSVPFFYSGISGLCWEVRERRSFLFRKDGIFPESLFGERKSEELERDVTNLWTCLIFFCAEKLLKKLRFQSSTFSCFGTSSVECFLKGTNTVLVFFALFVSTFGPDALVVGRSFLIKPFYSGTCCSGVQSV